MTSAITRQVQTAAASIVDRLPASSGPLAQPPAGSDLKPVMGDPGLPLMGHALGVLYETLEWSRRRQARYGNVSWYDIPGNRAVYVLGAEAIGTVLSNKDRAFGNADGWGEYLNPFFQRGVMLMDADEHMHHRRILQQAFTRPRLVGYLQAMNPVIDEVLSGWDTGSSFLLYPAAKQLTLNVATKVFMGAESGPESHAVDNAFVDTVGGTMAFVRANVPGGAYARGLRGRKLLEDYFRDRIPAKRAGDGQDLFSVLCRAQSEQGEKFTDEDIVNHMIFTMMAAHDTSTATLSTMAYFMAKYPQWQERARAESRALGKDAVDFDDLDRLTTLDLVMKESLRMFAPVGMQFRKTVRDTEIEGHYIPAGTIVTLGNFASHRSEQWWKDPDRFDPERFSEERREDKAHRTAWAPFGAGVHKCIGMYFGGMEIKAVLHQLLLRASWSVPEGYTMPVGYATGPIPGDGLPITLHELPGAATGDAPLGERTVARLLGQLTVGENDSTTTIPAISPSTLRTYAELPVYTAAQVADEVARCRETQRAWASRPIAERARVLLGFHDLLLDRQQEILDILQFEVGKARFTAHQEMAAVASVARYYARAGARHLRDKHPRGAMPGATSVTEIRVPKGVVGIVGPWNYPLYLSIGDALPALLAGNGVVIKADSQTALTVLWAAEQLERAGLPAGLLRVVTGPGSTVGTALIDAVDYVTFTGSTRTGRVVAAQAGQRLIGSSLELGGKNPMIVCADADLDKAVAGAVQGCFANAGQLCLSIERIYVHRSLYDRFVDRLVEQTARVRMGQSFDFASDLGPLVSAEQLKSVTEHVEDALAKGARVRAGGRVRGEVGPLCFEPTVLTDVTPEMRVYAEETFGPVVSVYPVDSDDAAVDAANAGSYGLNATVWTRDVARGQRLARRVIAGTVNVNDAFGAAIGSVDAAMGGMRDSGIGRRQGAEGILKYTESQTIATQRFLPMPPIPWLSPALNVRLANTSLRAMRRLGVR